MRAWRLLIPVAVLLVLLILAVTVLRQGGTAKTGTEVAQPFGSQPGGRKPLIFDLGALSQNAALRPKALDEVRSLGADAVRVVLPWAAVAPPKLPRGFRPSDPAERHYDFSTYDALLRQIDSRGMKILLDPSSPIPRWASSSGSDVDNPRPAQFASFVRALARRYGGGFDPGGPGRGAKPLPKVALWSVWNEPNLAIFLGPQMRDGKPYAPGLYRRLYQAAAESIHAEDAAAPVLIGETAPTAGDAGIDPIPFSRSVLCLRSDYTAIRGCGPIDAFGWSTHPYPVSTNPPFEPGGHPDFVTMDLLSGLEGVLAAADTAGTTKTDLPVYITEFGIQSVPDPLVGVSQAHQADYLAIAERIAYADPAVASFAQYLLRDDAPTDVSGQSFGGFESGLRTFGGTAKPALGALRTPLVVQRIGERAELWALVQPARGATSVILRYRDPGEVPRSLGRFRTDAAGVITRPVSFSPGRRWQVEWTDPATHDVHRGPFTPAYAFGLPVGRSGVVRQGSGSAAPGAAAAPTPAAP